MLTAYIPTDVSTNLVRFEVQRHMGHGKGWVQHFDVTTNRPAVYRTVEDARKCIKRMHNREQQAGIAPLTYRIIQQVTTFEVVH